MYSPLSMVAPILFVLGCAPESTTGTESEQPGTEPPPLTEVDTAPSPADLPVKAPAALDRAVGKPVSLRARDLVVLAGGVEIQVSYLVGSLRPVGEYVDLEVPTSFSVQVDALELHFPEQFLASTMTERAKGSPLNDLEVRTEGNAFVLEGHARVLNLPFTFRADPMVTEAGALALKLEKVRVLGISVKGFLGALAGPVEKAVNKRQHLLHVQKDLLIVDPFPFVGPPRVKAAFTSVEVQKGALVARLGEAPEPDDSLQGVRLAGGVLRSGSSVFFDTTLSLVAKDGGPLTIDPDRMDEQISAGFTKMVPEKRQITVHVASLEDLEDSKRRAAPP